MSTKAMTYGLFGIRGRSRAKHSKEGARSSRAVHPGKLLACMAAAVLTLPWIAASAFGKGGESIDLRDRSFIPDPGIDPGLMKSARARDGKVHCLVQLSEVISEASVEALDRRGIRVIEFLQGNTYVAAVSDVTRLRGSANLIKWAGPLLPDDKLDPSIKAGGKPVYGMNKGGEFNAMVVFHKDIGPDYARRILEAHRLDPVGGSENRWIVSTSRDRLASLAGEDAVKWIEPGPAPFMPLLEAVRMAVDADVVQELSVANGLASYAGFSGKGIRVAVLDSGVDPNHDDLWSHDATGAKVAPRVIVDTPSPSDPHGTHVAGIIAGNGFRSPAFGYPPFYRRGIAPEADLYSRNLDTGSPSPAYSSLFFDAVVAHGAEISNHSYVQTCESYGVAGAEIDGLVRGDGAYEGHAIPPSVAVWAAGNNGMNNQYCWPIGYYSILSPAKNPIVVASTDLDPRTRSYYSSLGPTSDGRLKPDLAAPGCHVCYVTREDSTAYGVWSAHAGGDDYMAMYGTSQAAPVVAGAAALLTELWKQRNSRNPLPSSIKAALVEGAIDQAHAAPSISDVNFGVNPDTRSAVLYGPGPDYATGYGQIDVAASLDLVSKDRILEGQVGKRSVLGGLYDITVPQGATRLRITLAWDDAPGSELSADSIPKLVNDLDLTVTGPDGAVHLPWVLDPLPKAPGDQAIDPISPTDVQPAHPGEDHRNNVEQIEVEAPQPGTWHVRVSPYAMPTLEAQEFSITADHPIAKFEPIRPRPFKLCGNYAWSPSDGAGISLAIRGGSKCGLVAFPPICRLALNCAGCFFGRCPNLEIRMRDNPAFRRILVLDERGRTLADGGAKGGSVVKISRSDAVNARLVVFPVPRVLRTGATSVPVRISVSG